jgi:large subunit ribosomal protein L6
VTSTCVYVTRATKSAPSPFRRIDTSASGHAATMMLSRPTAQLRHAAARCFSSTPAVLGGVTSNVGRVAIPIPDAVKLSPTPEALTVTGPLGTTSVRLEPYMHLSNPTPHSLALTVEDAKKKNQRAMWGLTRTLIANAVQGMHVGFSVPLHLVGVGYRAALETDPRGTEDGGSGQRLNMKLGYSHTVYVPIPPHIKCEVPAPTKIVLSCNDKHLLGLFAAKVRAWRKPEPYKGKVRVLSCLNGPFDFGFPNASSLFRVSSLVMSKLG